MTIKDTGFRGRENQRNAPTNTRPWAQIRPPEIKCAVCSIIPCLAGNPDKRWTKLHPIERRQKQRRPYRPRNSTRVTQHAGVRGREITFPSAGTRPPPQHCLQTVVPQPTIARHLTTKLSRATFRHFLSQPFPHATVVAVAGTP